MNPGDHPNVGLFSKHGVLGCFWQEAAWCRFRRSEAFYDDNGITIDGHTDLSFTEDVGKRFEAYGWQAQKYIGA